jgi:hypothetical protein
MKYIARQSENIEKDLARNWSSWNFGQDGIFCTSEELQSAINDCLNNETPLYISGMELWNDELRSADIRELYEGYFVLVDNVNAKNGLSFVELESDNLHDAKVEAENAYYAGDGVCYHANDVKLVWTDGMINIFEVK